MTNDAKNIDPPQEWLDAKQPSTFKEGAPDDFSPTQEMVDNACIKHIEAVHYEVDGKEV